jgi:integrase/recombinase XerD
MAQAKTLTKEEMTHVLDYINTRRFAQRNRAMMLLTHLAGAVERTRLGTRTV